MPSEWAKYLVKAYIISNGIDWEVGDITIDNAICIKIHDEYLQYLDIFNNTRQFMFCIDNHTDSIHPDDVSIYILQKYAGINIDKRVIETIFNN